MRLAVACLIVGIAVFLCAEVSADKHEIIKKIVLKKAFKALKKAPKLIPLVIPLPIIKHHKQHEVWKVQEVHGHGGWQQSNGWPMHGWD